MAETADLLVRIEATTALLRQELARADRSITDFTRKADRETKGAEGRVTATFGRMGAAAAGFAAGLLSLQAALNFGSAVVKATAEAQKLEASLRTVTGSADRAAAAFAGLQDFASRTPYSVQEVTQAFIKLKSLGLDPSEAALTSYGNTAAAMGASLEQMIEAVADATTGEFERLKEFGIRAASEGNKVTFTFQGVSKTVGKNAAEIEKYLRDIGNVQFGGAMAEQAKTVGGALSNLGDQWQQFKANIGDTLPIRGAVGALADLLAGINDLLTTTAEERVSAAAQNILSLESALAMARERAVQQRGRASQSREVQRLEKELAAAYNEQAEALRALKKLEKDRAEANAKPAKPAGGSKPDDPLTGKEQSEAFDRLLVKLTGDAIKAANSIGDYDDAMRLVRDTLASAATEQEKYAQQQDAVESAIRTLTERAAAAGLSVAEFAHSLGLPPDFIDRLRAKLGELNPVVAEAERRMRAAHDEYKKLAAEDAAADNSPFSVFPPAEVEAMKKANAELERSAKRFGDTLAQALTDGSFEAADIWKSAAATELSDIGQEWYKDIRKAMDDSIPGLTGALGAAFAGFGIGQSVGTMVGLSEGKSRNAGIGAGLGAGGAYLAGLGPWGIAAAGAIGFLGGSLFGPGKSSGPNANAAIGLQADGTFRRNYQAADNDGNLAGVSKLADQLAAAVNSILDFTGGTVGSQPDYVRIGQNKNGFVAGWGSQFSRGGVDLKAYATEEEAVAAALALVFRNGVEGATPAMTAALQKSLGQSVESINEALGRAAQYDAFVSPPKALGEYAARLEEVNAAAKQAADFARDYGLALDEVTAAQRKHTDGLRSEFATAIEDELRGLLDPVGQQIVELDRRFVDLRKEAEALFAGTDQLTDVQGKLNDLYGVQRAAIEEVTASARGATDALRSMADILRERQSLETHLLQLEGDKLGLRRQERDALDPSNRALFDLVTATEDMEDARSALIDVYGREIDTQQELARQYADTQSRMAGFARSLREFRLGLLVGEFSPLDPQQRFAEAQRQFRDVSRRAQLGDMDAIASLEGAAQRYLEANRDFYATTNPEAFWEVQGALERTESLAERQARIAQEQLNVANTQVSILNMQLAAVRENVQATLSLTQALTEFARSVMAVNAQRAALGMGPSTATHAGAVAHMMNNQGVDVVDRAEAYLRANPDVAAAAGSSWWQQQFPGATPAEIAMHHFRLYGAAEGRAFADGGFAAPGLALVGERGPELVDFRMPARVYTNHDLRSALQGGGQNEALLARAVTLLERLVGVSEAAGAGSIQGLQSLDRRMAEIERKAGLAQAA